MRHRPPVLDHIRDPRWRAQIVFEHAHPALGVANEVDAGHVHAHTARRRDAAAREPVEVTRRDDQAAGYDAVTHDLAVAVHVAEEPFERAHALLDTALDDRPLCRGENARDEIEWERPFLTRQGERDPLVAKDTVPGGAPFVEIGTGQGLHVLVERVVVDAGLPGRVEHLVPGFDWLVCVEEITHHHPP